MPNERIKNDSRLLERALSATQGGVMITDASSPDDPIVYVNRAFEEITGYAPEEVLGRNPRLLQAGDRDQPTIDDLRASRRVHNNDIEWTGVLRNYKKDGALFYNELVAAAVRDEGGRATHHVGVVTDVTERVRSEERLRFQAELLDAVGQAVVAVDLSGRVVYWNRAAEGLYGWTAEEAVGRPADGVMVSEDQMERAFEIWAELAAGRGWSGEFVVRRRDGTSFPAMVTNTPVFDERGDLAGVIGVSADVTERRGAEEALKESERRFRQLFENSVDALFVIDPETRGIADCNREACRSLGYRREELLGMRLDDFASEVLPEEEKKRRGGDTPWRRALAGEPGTIIGFHENVHRRKDGATFPVEVGVGSIDYAGRRLILASCRDATERKEAEEAQRRSEARLAEAQRIARVGNWEYAVGEDEGHWSDETYRIFGRDPEGFVPTYKTFLRSVHPEDRRTLPKVFRRALREGKHYGHSVEFRVVRPDGGTRVVHARYEVVREDEAGRPVRVAGTLQDVTERKALEEKLEHQAFHDPLTGLPNRALFSDRLGHAFSRAERRGGKFAVLFVDLDNFKYVNDSLGHETGDDLLALAAGRLRGCVRPGDTVARLGGDEFAVLLEGAGDLHEAARVAARVVEALGEPFDLGGREVFSGASVGIALGEAGRERPEDLLRKADLALYEAKHGGKAGYAVFDPEAERRSVRRLEMLNGLRRAVERDEFVVRYQPVVSLETGRIAGFEALVRWEHPERGLVPPDEFVPLAEENGTIVPIGLYVLREACRLAKEWQGPSPAGPPPSVGVNLSARQLSHPDLLADVEGALAEAGLDPGRLTLEVTESVLVEHAGRHSDALRGLKDLGVRFAIDDFGTGYSSLSYLRRLPAELVKLDGSFVAGIGEGAEEDEVLVSGVVGIAHAFGLEVVAEGVETAEQATRLRELGCDLAQGSRFSGPLAGEEAAALLRANPAGFDGP